MAGTAGIDRSDALLNIQADGTIRAGRNVQLSGPGATGSTDLLAGQPLTVTVGLGDLAEGSALQAWFDLLGFGTATSRVRIDDVRLITDAGPSMPPPQALDDRFTLEEDGSLTGNVLANDVDSAVGGLVVERVEGPTHGLLELQANGHFVYRPQTDFFGADRFVYRITDGNGRSAEALVSLTVTAVNDAPVVSAIALTLDQDAAIEFDLAAFITDVDDPLSALSIAVLQDPEHGRLESLGEQRYRYTPVANYHGTDQLRIGVSDGQATTDAVLIFLTRPVSSDSGENRPPQVSAAAITTTEDRAIRFDLLAVSDSHDPDGDELAVSSIGIPANGSLRREPDGHYVYTPNANWFGTGTLRFEITDGIATTSAELTITVEAVNDEPVAADDQAQVRAGEAIDIDVLDNDYDVDGDRLEVMVGTPASLGTLTVLADGRIRYVANAGVHGEDRFTYCVFDGIAWSEPATVTVQILADSVSDNQAPIAPPITAQTEEDQPVRIDPLSASRDPDGDPLTLSRISSPQHGTLEQQPDGSFRYTPSLNWHGVEVLTYAVSDGRHTVESSITIVVLPVADAPNLYLTPRAGDIGSGGSQGTVVVTPGAWLRLPAISASLSDDSETLRILLNALPPGTKVSDGHHHVKIDHHAPVDARYLDVTDWNLANLQILLPAHLTGPVTIRIEAISTEPSGGHQTITTAPLHLTVHAIDQPPQVHGQPHRGTCEDEPVLFAWADFGITDVDTPIEHLGIVIDQLPRAGQLELRIGDCWEPVRAGQIISHADIEAGALRYMPPPHGAGDGIGAFIYRAVSLLDPQGANSNPGRMNIDVIPVADAPCLQLDYCGIDTLSTLTDQPLRLPRIDAWLVDRDGSETLTLTLEGLPVGALLTDGCYSVRIADPSQTVDLTCWNFAMLTVTVPPGCAGTYCLTVTATATESTGETACTSASIVIRTNEATKPTEGRKPDSRTPDPVPAKPSPQHTATLSGVITKPLHRPIRDHAFHAILRFFDSWDDQRPFARKALPPTDRLHLDVRPSSEPFTMAEPSVRIAEMLRHAAAQEQRTKKASESDPLDQPSTVRIDWTVNPDDDNRLPRAVIDPVADMLPTQTNPQAPADQEAPAAGTGPVPWLCETLNMADINIGLGDWANPVEPSLSGPSDKSGVLKQ